MLTKALDRLLDELGEFWAACHDNDEDAAAEQAEAAIEILKSVQFAEDSGAEESEEES